MVVSLDVNVNVVAAVVSYGVVDSAELEATAEDSLVLEAVNADSLNVEEYDSSDTLCVDAARVVVVVV